MAGCMGDSSAFVVVVLVLTPVPCMAGFMGYSSYAPTKWALRGLADTLRNELIGFGIAVQVRGHVTCGMHACMHPGVT